MAGQTPPLLHISDYLSGNSRFHLARRRFEPGGVLPVHGHDFTELVWVEEGSGTHTINERQESVTPGWIRLAGPRDLHAIQGSWSDSLRIANLAFRTEELAPLERLVATGAGEEALRTLRSGELVLPRRILHGVQQSAAALISSRATTLDLVRFLVGLLAEIEELRAHRAVDRDLPGWLVHARSLLERDEMLLAGGLAALCEIARRTPDHVNRTVRRYYGTTATGLVNDLRLDHAEFLLRATDRTISDVALSSGFASIGYFHARFRQRHETTPRAYRNSQQGPVRV